VLDVRALNLGAPHLFPDAGIASQFLFGACDHRETSRACRVVASREGRVRFSKQPISTISPSLRMLLEGFTANGASFDLQ
jgi:hypothetical protein